MMITDVHLSLDVHAEPSIIFPGQRLASPDQEDEFSTIRAAIHGNPDKKMIHLSNGERWRVQKMREGRFALRKMRNECPTLPPLNIPEWIRAHLLASSGKKHGGLIMIFGLAGAGKTTTFSATISERLKLHGGYGLSIEDPPEDRLEGKHGANGYCEQIDADEVGGYAKAIHAALRCFPAKDSSILGYGEVRDGETAAQLLRVAVDGHLVIFTCHARSISAGIGRVIALAKSGGESNAEELLASSFHLAIHQKFDDKGALHVSALPYENNKNGIKNLIKESKLDAIDQVVEKVNLLNANSIKSR